MCPGPLGWNTQFESQTEDTEAQIGALETEGSTGAKLIGPTEDDDSAMSGYSFPFIRYLPLFAAIILL